VPLNRAGQQFRDWLLAEARSAGQMGVSSNPPKSL
jgi:hypothetical protein